MTLVDANLLLYAVNVDAPHHRVAKSWLERALSGTETLAFTWPVLLAFLRLATRRSMFEQPLTVDQAFEVLDSWLDQPNVTILHPTVRHGAVLKELLLPLGTAGNLTSDADLAAIALEHGAELCSTDRDFARFPAVRWTNPLAQGATR